MSLYRVTGQRAYRGYQPGSQFEASLDPSAEQRAVARGDITVIQRSTPTIQPERYTPPAGWHTKQEG